MERGDEERGRGVILECIVEKRREERRVEATRGEARRGEERRGEEETGGAYSNCRGWRGRK